MATNSKDTFGDDRLKKDAGTDTHGSRDSADVSRVEDGTALSAEARRRMLRQDWVQEVLPTPPKIPGFHCCWLSTTNSTDPIYKRIQRGYVPVKASEVPGFGSGQYVAKEGEFEGCIICNEMLLFKIDEGMYNDLMVIYHHEIPQEQEQSIYDRVAGNQRQDSDGRDLVEVEGGFKSLGRKVPTPNFTQ